MPVRNLLLNNMICDHHTMEEVSDSRTANIFMDTLSLGDEPEDSEPDSSLAAPFSKRPHLPRPKCSKKFKRSWNTPFFLPSKKGEKFTYCSLCSCDFSLAQRGGG